MFPKNKILKLTAALMLMPVAGGLFVALPAVAQAQIESRTALAEKAFPLLKGFYNLPAGERDQVRLGYVLRVKGAKSSDVNITLSHNGEDIPIRIGAGGILSPLPTRAQLNDGATVTISGPKSGGVALRLRAYSTQPLSKTLDAKALATGVTQSNSAVRKIAGLLARTSPKVDRAVFIGAGGGVAVMADGQEQPLPTYSKGNHPFGTPYFAPSKMPNAVEIRLNRAPSVILYDMPPN